LINLYFSTWTIACFIVIISKKIFSVILVKVNTKQQKIYREFDGKLVGTKKMKEYVCETVALMPPSIMRKITTGCWFMSSMDDAWAYTFLGNDLKDQYLVFLGDDLLSQPAEQIRYSIAHEIGHIILGHQNSVMWRQTKHEVGVQEKEADEFARKYS
jgi:hypothetical protein